MIARRHLHLLIALVLPLMVVRSMLPDGYMPVAENGGFRMVLCTAGQQTPPVSGDSGNHPISGHGSDCLFANAAASGPPPAAFALAAFEYIDAPSAAISSAQQTPGVIPRAQTSRGPPVRH